MLAATAYLKLNSTDLFLSYFLLEPMLLLLNVLPPILLIWFFYFLPAGPGQLSGQLPPLCGTWALVNYFKIRLRTGTLCWPPTCAWSLRRGGSWDTISWT